MREVRITKTKNLQLYTICRGSNGFPGSKFKIYKTYLCTSMKKHFHFTPEAWLTLALIELRSFLNATTWVCRLFSHLRQCDNWDGHASVVQKCAYSKARPAFFAEQLVSVTTMWYWFLACDGDTMVDNLSIYQNIEIYQ